MGVFGFPSRLFSFCSTFTIYPAGLGIDEGIPSHDGWNAGVFWRMGHGRITSTTDDRGVLFPLR